MPFSQAFLTFLNKMLTKKMGPEMRKNAKSETESKD
jgi:hypothetical protein